MLLLKRLFEGIIALNEIFVKDKRISIYPLLGKPYPMIFIIVLYLLTVLKWGPRFMANRNAYKIDGIVKLYNIMQIALNSMIFYEALKYYVWRDDFNWSCQKYDITDTSPYTMKLVRPTLLYYYSKYLDLLETIFFIMRKKFNQVSFLHVYHHTLMTLAVYCYCTDVFASHFSITGILNSFIHVCMYIYYLLASLKLNINLEPLKRTLTIMQLIQFAILVILFGVPLFNNWCQLPLFWLVVAFLQNIFMIILFSNFYYKAYILKDRKKRNMENNKTN